MDIWHTASASSDYINTGWIGRYLDAQCSGCDKPTQALEVDDVLSLALKGEKSKGLAFRDPRRLYGTSQEKFFKDISAAHHPQEETVDYLYKTMAETISSADYIFKQSRLHPSSATYPSTQIGQNLKTVASLIFSDINTRVYYLSIGSFDTHVNQQPQQDRLFKELNDGLQAFVQDLKSDGRMDDALIFTFSEFGRRFAECQWWNRSGTANNMFSSAVD
jgi:uncharacterized protein (DUF1501 family)